MLSRVRASILSYRISWVFLPSQSGSSHVHVPYTSRIHSVHHLCFPRTEMRRLRVGLHVPVGAGLRAVGILPYPQSAHAIVTGRLQKVHL